MVGVNQVMVTASWPQASRAIHLKYTLGSIKEPNVSALKCKSRYCNVIRFMNLHSQSADCRFAANRGKLRHQGQYIQSVPKKILREMRMSKILLADKCETEGAHVPIKRPYLTQVIC